MRKMNNIERYIHIATVMNTFEIGEEFTIGELAKRAKVHHSTAKKALYFFDWLLKNFQAKIHPSLAYAIKNKNPFERIIMIKRKVKEK